jgi:hypothetical protein
MLDTARRPFGRGPAERRFGPGMRGCSAVDPEPFASGAVVRNVSQSRSSTSHVSACPRRRHGPGGRCASPRQVRVGAASFDAANTAGVSVPLDVSLDADDAAHMRSATGEQSRGGRSRAERWIMERRRGAAAEVGSKHRGTRQERCWAPAVSACAGVAPACSVEGTRGCACGSDEERRLGSGPSRVSFLISGAVDVSRGGGSHVSTNGRTGMESCHSPVEKRITPEQAPGGAELSCASLGGNARASILVRPRVTVRDEEITRILSNNSTAFSSIDPEFSSRSTRRPSS